MQEMDFSQRRQIVSNSLFMCPLAPYLKLKTFKDDDLDHILGKRKLVVVNNNMVYGNSLFERHTPLTVQFHHSLHLQIQRKKICQGSGVFVYCTYLTSGTIK